MRLKSIITDRMLYGIRDYYVFSGEDDNYHEELTLKTLKRFENGEGIVKEFDVLGRKTKKTYLKSTGYYWKNLQTLCIEPKIHDLGPELYKSENINDYFNSSVYIKETRNLWSDKEQEFERSIKFLPLEYEISAHKHLYFQILKFQLGLCTESSIADFIIKSLEEDLGRFVKKNSFKDGNSNGSSHEFGYWLNYIIDYLGLTENEKLESSLKKYFEKLDAIFVQKKMFYHDVIGKNRTIINVSGILLISKAFLRYTKYTKDYRYANTAFFLIDLSKTLQLRNRGFLQNTFPVHSGNSKFKFPSWTLNYFLENLILKKQILSEFENSFTDKLSSSR